MKELRVINTEEVKEHSVPEKKTRKKWFSLFFTFVLVIIVYLIINICIGVGKSYSVYTVSRGEYDDTIKVKGCLFREQKLINAPVSGFLNCNAAENARVSVGSEVAVIYNKEIDGELSARIRKINLEIAALNENRIKDSAVYSENWNELNRYFSNEIKKAVSSGSSKNFSGITEASDAVIAGIKKKRGYESQNNGITERKSELEELKAQRDKLISENNIQGTSLISDTAGVFSSKIDGLEESLDIAMLNGLTPSYIDEIMNRKISDNVSIEAGKPVCKIVNNFEWYFAAVLSADEADLISVGQSVKLRFFDITNNAVLGEVIYISPKENERAAVVIKSNKYVDSIYTLSRASVDIIKKQYTGLKIPADSIRVSDNKTGVYVLRHGVSEFVNVDVIYSDGKWAIIRECAEGEAGIKLYDEIILNAKNLYDGKSMK